MTLTLDPEVEQRFQAELKAGGYASPSDLIAHLLDLSHAGGFEERDTSHAIENWLMRNKEAINAALDDSFAAKERGESYSPEEALERLAEHRAARKARAA